jgi:hypothetical protein
MNGHRQRIGNFRMAKDVMAPSNPLDVPALGLEDPDHVLTGDRRELFAHPPTATRSRCTVGIWSPSSSIVSI